MNLHTANPTHLKLKPNRVELLYIHESNPSKRAYMKPKCQHLKSHEPNATLLHLHKKIYLICESTCSQPHSIGD